MNPILHNTMSNIKPTHAAEYRSQYRVPNGISYDVHNKDTSHIKQFQDFVLYVPKACRFPFAKR